MRLALASTIVSKLTKSRLYRRLEQRIEVMHSYLVTCFLPLRPAHIRVTKRPGFLRQTRGAAVMEFAILAPVLIFIILSTIELGVVLFAMTALEHAVADASRYGKTGYVPEGTTRQQHIIAIIADDIGEIMNPDNIQLTTLVYNTFSEVGVPEPFTDANGNSYYDEGETYNDVNGNGQWDEDMGASGAGGPGDVVIYKVQYDWEVMTPVIRQLLADRDGIIRLSSSLAVRNEPFESLVLGAGT